LDRAQADQAEEKRDGRSFESDETPAIERGVGTGKLPLLGQFGNAVPSAIAGRPPEVFQKAVGGECHQGECGCEADNPRSVIGHE
jgi:hypothetical protein